MKKFVYVFAALVIAIVGALAASDPADAKRYRGKKANQASQMNWENGMFNLDIYPQARASRSARSTRSARRSNRGFDFSSLTGGGGLGPRPRAWCGWWMRSQLGGGPAYNLAWNWRHYGSPSSPHVGAVVVWRHHVGMITGQASNGHWIVKSGNDSGRVRERARSVAGAIFRA